MNNYDRNSFSYRASNVASIIKTIIFLIVNFFEGIVIYLVIKHLYRIINSNVHELYSSLMYIQNNSKSIKQCIGIFKENTNIGWSDFFSQCQSPFIHASIWLNIKFFGSIIIDGIIVIFLSIMFISACIGCYFLLQRILDKIIK